MVLLRACPILKLIQPMVHPDSRLRHGRFRNFPLSFTFLTDVCWTEILQEKRHFIRSNFGYPHLVTILTAYATWKWILKHFKNIILREHTKLILWVYTAVKNYRQNCSLFHAIEETVTYMAAPLQTNLLYSHQAGKVLRKWNNFVLFKNSIYFFFDSKYLITFLYKGIRIRMYTY